MATGVRPPRGKQKDPLLGTCLGGRYQILRCLGRGSMGAVYEALQLPIQRRCAVKVLLDQLEGEDVLRHRFQREARAVSLLNHANLVTLYDFGIEESGRPYLAMEFLEGEPLSSLIPFQDLSLRDVISIIEQILLAFAEVHQHGIIHRDLKPENVFLSPGLSPHRFHIKVLDFGLAKLLESDDQVMLTATGEIYGTPLYMSPEQGTGSSAVTAATDVYAIGIMFYELLSGHPPFGGRTPIAILTQHARRAVPPLRPRRGLQMSQPLVDLIYQCLAKNPEERFFDAHDVLNALAATSEGQRYLQHQHQRRSSQMPGVVQGSLLSSPMRPSRALSVSGVQTPTVPDMPRVGAPLSTIASELTSGVTTVIDDASIEEDGDEEEEHASSRSLTFSLEGGAETRQDMAAALAPAPPALVSAPALNLSRQHSPHTGIAAIRSLDSDLFDEDSPHLHPTAWVTRKPPGFLRRLMEDQDEGR